jgi:Cytochrome c553
MNKLVTVFVSAALLVLAPSLLQAQELQGDPAAGQAKIAVCATCHGQDGNSELSMNPKLAGQNAAYITKQLQNYKSGERQNAVMSGMAAALSEQDIADIAAWYSSQTVTLEGADPENLELGEQLYRAGNADLGVASCSACHGPQGKGNGPAGFPSLGGQHAEYTLTQLKYFRSGERANDRAAMMRSNVERLTDAELEALADYISGLH